MKNKYIIPQINISQMGIEDAMMLNKSDAPADGNPALVKGNRTIEDNEDEIEMLMHQMSEEEDSKGLSLW